MSGEQYMGASAEDWRSFYKARASLSDWVRAHGWGYSPELAFQTISDIRLKLGLKPHERILESVVPPVSS
jgi:hypothetical protein